MRWQAKATLMALFSVAPRGEVAHYWFQRHVTKSLPMPDRSLAQKIERARHHAGRYQQYGAKPITESVFYEFGAGWDLAIPLCFAALGVKQQVVVDLRRLARPELVRATVDGLSRLVPDLPTAKGETVDDILTANGIEYRAPSDAAKTGMPSGSVDCITSSNTLEHIPPDSIVAILRECHRLLADDGIMSFSIDYTDHWSHADKRISYLNYLRYSTRQWRFLSPALHYQNRLRHSDYERLFSDAGFRQVCMDQVHQTPANAAELLPGRVDQRFAAYSLEDLVMPNARVVLVKA